MREQLVVEVMAGAAELCVPLEVNLSVGSQLGGGEGLTKEERMAEQDGSAGERAPLVRDRSSS